MKFTTTAILAAALFTATHSAQATSCVGPMERANSLAVQVTKDGEIIPSTDIFWAGLNAIEATFPRSHHDPDVHLIAALKPSGHEYGRFIRDKSRPIQATPEVAQHLTYFEELRTPDCGDCPSLSYLLIPPGLYVPDGRITEDASGTLQDVTLTVPPDRSHVELSYTKDGAQFSIKYNMYWPILPEYDQSCGCAVSTGAGFPGIAWFGASMVLLGLRRSTRRQPEGPLCR